MKKETKDNKIDKLKEITFSFVLNQSSSEVNIRVVNFKDKRQDIFFLFTFY